MFSFINNLDNREFLTFIECVGVNEFLLLLILIMTFQILSEVTFIDELLVNYLVLYNEIKYSNNEINNEWIHYFDKFIRVILKDTYYMLISDDFNTYIEFEFI